MDGVTLLRKEEDPPDASADPTLAYIRTSCPACKGRISTPFNPHSGPIHYQHGGRRNQVCHLIVEPHAFGPNLHRVEHVQGESIEAVLSAAIRRARLGHVPEAA